MNHTDLIEKYIQNKATAEELAEIKRLMTEDAGFKDELSFQLELREAIKGEERQQLKERLQNLEQQKKVKPLFPLLWKIAAVFVIGLGLLWVFNQPVGYDKLYADNFEPYPNIVMPAVRDATPDKNKQAAAFSHYDNRNYKEAVKAFEELYLEDKTDYIGFYYAMSLMADNQVEKAVEILENPDREIPQKYQTQANWYLALGYLKIENKEKARTYLEKTITDDGVMTEQALKILMKIK